MKKIKLYIAVSLNNKIADMQGRVDWLEQMPNPNNEDYGYYDFYNNIGVTIQGNKTYNQLLSWGIDFPYFEKKNYVFTHDSTLQDNEHVSFVSSNHAHFVKELKLNAENDIWLIGGGTINSFFLRENLIDELYICTMPIILEGGIDLFEGEIGRKKIELIDVTSYDSGAIMSRYKVIV